MVEPGVRVPGTLEASLTSRRGDFSLDVDLAVAPDEVLAVLGPNGAGKSTLLRVLAGLVPATTGRVTLGDEPLDDVGTGVFVPTARRPVGLVFQDYRLFPHLSVLDNVAFAPRSRGANRGASRADARTWLARFDLLDLAERAPASLSGGQAQRVALARALAGRPELLLLDEPLAALDARTRLDVLGELRDLLREFAGPCLIVTHDPVDAAVLADRLLVLEDGRIVQQGAPADIARRPATDYVARLVGLNLYPATARAGVLNLDGGGTLVAQDTGHEGRVFVAMRPSSIVVSDTDLHGVSSRNSWPGTLVSLTTLHDRVRLEVDGTPAALVDVTAAAVAELGLAPDSRVWLSVKATELAVYPAPAPDPRAADPAHATGP
jgi:molybdate transport system ATP-binding protein